MSAVVFLKKICRQLPWHCLQREQIMPWVSYLPMRVMTSWDSIGVLTRRKRDMSLGSLLLCKGTWILMCCTGEETPLKPPWSGWAKVSRVSEGDGSPILDMVLPLVSTQKICGGSLNVYTNIPRYNLINDSGLQLNKLCCNIVLNRSVFLLNQPRQRYKCRIVGITAVFYSRRR